MKKIFELLQWGSEYLNKKKIGSSKIDAEILLADILKVPRLEFILLKDKNLNKKTIEKFKNFIKRHGRYEPVAYILGNTEFMSLKFFVNKLVLIPRPETEILAEKIIKYINENKIKKPQILDIGTGSGALAVSIAKNIRDAEVTAADISKKALKIARKNAEYNNVKNIQFKKSNLFDAFFLKKNKFDIIVSNPPYVSRDEFKEISLFVKKYEPKKALYGGKDGLDIIRKIIKYAPDYLKAKGLLALEVGYRQAKKTIKLMEDAKFRNISAVKDLSGIDRVISGEKNE